MTQDTSTRSMSTVGRYVEFWNAADADDQQRLAAEIFTDHVTSHVPVGIMRGAGELICFRNQFAQHSPGYTFRLREESDAHHGRARLRWELVVDGATFATGTDVLELDPEGRIVSITGFLDRAPEGFGSDAHH